MRLLVILLLSLLTLSADAKPKPKKAKSPVSVTLLELNLGWVDGGSMATETFPLPGAKIGDAIIVVPLGSASGATMYYGYVPNRDTVQIIVLPQARFSFMDYQINVYRFRK